MSDTVQRWLYTGYMWARCQLNHQFVRIKVFILWCSTYFCVFTVLKLWPFFFSASAWFYFSFYRPSKHFNPLLTDLYQPLFSPARSIVQTPRQLNTQRRDTNFFSARDISRMLNKANSCIEFWWRKAKPSIWASPQKKAELSFKYIPGRKESILCYHESLFT